MNKMFNQRLLPLAGAIAAVFSGVAADATTYIGTRVFDGTTVSLSITTNGVLGTVLGSDITDFFVRITNAEGFATISSNLGGRVESRAQGFIATDHDLKFDFSSSEINIIHIAREDERTPFYGLYSGKGNGDERAYNLLGARANSGQEGLQVIASVSIPSVPDPAIWMTMMLGFGVLGMALRGARHSTGIKTTARL